MQLTRLEHVWNLLVGTDFSKSFCLEAVLLVLVLAPWPMALNVGWPNVGGTMRRLRRWGSVYLFTRLMTDFQLWAPIIGFIATIVAAWPLRASRRRGLSSVALPVSGCVVGTVATTLALLAPAMLATRWLVCLALVGWVLCARNVRHDSGQTAGGARGKNGGPSPDAGHKPAVFRWTHLLSYLWTAFVLQLSLDGVTVRTFLPVTIIGAAGWLTVSFVIWRGTRRQSPNVAPHEEASPRLAWTLRATNGVAWLATVLLATVIAAEVYFRCVYDASDGNTDLKTSKLWFQRHVHYNSWGYRDREFEPLERFRNDLRVVVIGDSFGFGQGIADPDDLLGARLEEELARRFPDGPGVSVFNLAIGGMATTQELRRFQANQPRLKPHAVVWVYMLNDIGEVALRAVHHPMPNMWKPLTEPSYAIEFAVWRAYIRWYMPGRGQPPPDLLYYEDADIFARHCQDIEKLVRVIHGSGCSLVTVVYPFLDIPADDSLQRGALDRVVAAFDALGVPAVDSSRVLDLNDRKYIANRFDAHPSAAVNREIAPILADLLAGPLAETRSRK